MPNNTNLRLVLIGAGLVGFIAGFLAWLEQPNGFGHSMNAYDSRLVPLATWAPLACLAAAVVVWLETFRDVDMRDKALGFSGTQIAIVCGALTMCIGFGFSRLDLAYLIGPGTYLGMFTGVTMLCVGMLDQYRSMQSSAAKPDVTATNTATTGSSPTTTPAAPLDTPPEADVQPAVDDETAATTQPGTPQPPTPADDAAAADADPVADEASETTEAPSIPAEESGRTPADPEAGQDATEWPAPRQQ